MLITKTHYDVQTSATGQGKMRIYVIAPTVPGYPHAKFPGVVVFRYASAARTRHPGARFVRISRSAARFIR